MLIPVQASERPRRPCFTPIDCGDHPKAMPVLLTTAEEWRTWLEAPVDEALQLQRPHSDEMMAEMAQGSR